MPLSRETCRICWRANPVGFYVPDDVWNAVIPPEHLSNVVCISCFARLADEKLVPWDRDIQLYPVSMHTHLQDVKPDLLESIRENTRCRTRRSCRGINSV
jgi:hypothetical protein